MRILHTADWHIGAKTDDLDRFEEQKLALKQVIEISKRYNVDMVIIAGDIYENLVPAAEDEELFYKTIVELSRNGDCAVVAIAGNHDDPKRLSNANVFADKFGIYLVGYYDEISIDKSRRDTNIFATNCGKGFIEFETKAGEKAVVALLPFPSFYIYKCVKKQNDNLQDKISSWLMDGTSHFRDDTIDITVAHLTSYGIDMDPDEYLTYTTLSSTYGYVDQKILPSNAQYTALGHIHRTLTVNKDKNIFYSGSLINQFFSVNNDTPTNVIIADLDSNGVKNIIKQPLDVKLLKKFTVNSVAEAHKVLNEHPENLVKIVIENVDSVDGDIDNTQYTPYITMSDVKSLRSKHPNLVTLSVITNQARAHSEFTSKKNLTNGEIFDNFVKAKNGTLPEPKVKELFLSLMSEDLYEAD